MSWESEAWQEPQQPTGSTPQVADNKNWAVFAHLSALAGFMAPFVGNVVGPLVIFLVKKDEDPFVKSHALEALNFQISYSLYGIALLFSSAVLGLLTFGLGFLLLPVLVMVVMIPWFMLIIVATIAASDGRPYRYPLTIRFVS